MSTTKKPKPSFDVPAEVESVGDSGWVYRSEKEPEKETVAESAVSAVSESALNESAALISLAFAVMAQALTLVGMVATIPLSLTMRTLEALDE